MTIRLIMTLAFLMLSVVGIKAQSNEDQGLTVSGNVHDAELKEPMVQATVQLFR